MYTSYIINSTRRAPNLLWEISLLWERSEGSSLLCGMFPHGTLHSQTYDVPFMWKEPDLTSELNAQERVNPEAFTFSYSAKRWGFLLHDLRRNNVRMSIDRRESQGSTAATEPRNLTGGLWEALVR